LIIKIWGCRGSITTPGPATVRYGGNTTCLEIRSSDGKIYIVDAGSGIRNLGRAIRLEPSISDIRFFFTHSHWDHLVGFPFFAPAYFENYKITLCSGPHAEKMVGRYLNHQMEPPYFPVEFSKLKARFDFDCRQPALEGDDCSLGGMQCRAFPLNHPNGGFGFKFTEQGKSFVFLTDNELGFRHEGGLTLEQYKALCSGVDLLLHDAQYTEEEYLHTRGWGHSTFKAAVDLAMEAGVKRFGIFHHDPDRTDDDLDRQLDYCRELIRRAGSPVDCFACAEGMVISI
jgi:phosphoribosyl 1,2-cyclic phosphodiesterase